MSWKREEEMLSYIEKRKKKNACLLLACMIFCFYLGRWCSSSLPLLLCARQWSPRHWDGWLICCFSPNGDSDLCTDVGVFLKSIYIMCLIISIFVIFYIFQGMPSMCSDLKTAKNLRNMLIFMSLLLRIIIWKQLSCDPKIIVKALVYSAVKMCKLNEKLVHHNF